MTRNESAQQRQHRVVLGLGSNVDPRTNLPIALELLRKRLQVYAVSTAWETPAVGSSGPDFLNAALLVRTNLPLEELKARVIREVEVHLGRVRTANKNAPRTIDIDILIYDDEVLEPMVWTQAFLAVPLAELVPGFTHPTSGETMSQVAQRLVRVSTIRPCPAVLGKSSPSSN